MERWFGIVGARGTVELFGVTLVGVNAENGKKLLISIGLIAFMLLFSRALRALVDLLMRRRKSRLLFWARQGARLLATGLLFIGLISIWFDDPARLATGLGLVTAGLAFALQKVITAVAGYFIILRGNTFNVGDRIRMGGVRGDVIALDFIKTTIMEMGQPPPVQADEPAVWVQSRQYTGRIVTVSNAVLFDEPVYNYSRDFPYVWEEMHVPIPYRADRMAAERILLSAAERHTVMLRALSADSIAEAQRRYFLKPSETTPQVYCRLTDNWLELTLRFIARDHGVRELKDALTRDILHDFEEAGIAVASATFEIAGMPPLQIDGEIPRRRLR